MIYIYIYFFPGVSIGSRYDVSTLTKYYGRRSLLN